MIPPEYLSFFSTMAAVGATLFGLIFVAISIVPESVATPNTSLDRQVRATTSYLALLNPLMISLWALIPHQQIGFVSISMGILGLLNTLGMVLTLIRSPGPSVPRFRHSLFILAGFFLYGSESYFAFHLIQSPADNVSLFFLADFLVVISIFGVIRAWELIGMQRFYLINWLSSIGRKKNPANDIQPESTGRQTTGEKEKIS
jgi:hypothetical protein